MQLNQSETTGTAQPLAYHRLWFRVFRLTGCFVAAEGRCQCWTLLLICCHGGRKVFAATCVVFNFHGDILSCNNADIFFVAAAQSQFFMVAWQNQSLISCMLWVYSCLYYTLNNNKNQTNKINSTKPTNVHKPLYALRVSSREPICASFSKWQSCAVDMCLCFVHS